MANQGIVIVGVQANFLRDERGRRRHDHMVTVRPEPIPGLAASYERKLADQGKPRQIVPIVNNIGQEIRVESADTAFRNKTQPVHYYAPRKR